MYTVLPAVGLDSCILGNISLTGVLHLTQPTLSQEI